MKSIIVALFLLASPVLAQERAANHLVGQTSPYLKQHLYNVVDWYPWGPEALNKARTEGKPIFLSIGYASCHWCHVMEEESFENDEIGAFLNEHFVAIKIDREERPDLDEQFMLVTQTVTGGGGWPNSVFLTSEAQPFYGGTYYPPDTFLSILQQLSTMWRDDRPDIEENATALGNVVREYLGRKAAAYPLTAEIAAQLAQQSLATMDDFNGGFGVAPKFPQESSLLFLLDQAERISDTELLEAVQMAAVGMVNGGLHDQVGGGFHRYAVDNAWAVPHFEKMLYNQALIGRVLLRLDSLQPNPSFARAAQRAFDYVLRDMTAPDGGFYAAEDADSLTTTGELEEGVFYVWTPAQVRTHAGAEAEFLIDALTVEEDGNFEGASTLQLSGEEVDVERLDAGLELLRHARMLRPKPRRDDKVLLSWNAEMIVTLVQAARAFDRPEYLTAAQSSARFILAKMRNGEGYYRVNTGGIASIDAQLPDYAGFGRALVALADADPAGDWLAEAERIGHYLVEHFQQSDGLFRMNDQAQGLGDYIQLDDGVLPSGSAQVQLLLSALARRSSDVFFSQQADALTDILSGQALAAPVRRIAAIAAVDAQNRGEVGPVRAVANGAVLVSTAIDRGEGLLNLNIEIAEGWHINAHEPLEDYFIPTTLEVNGTGIGADAYPDPLIATLSFNEASPLALYEGRIALSVPIEAGANAVTLTLQSCSDEICLAPESLSFSFW